MTRRVAILAFLLSALSLLVAFLPAGAGTIFVSVGATGADNGSSWADAYTDLQSALTTAISGDAIWVAAGTYKPTSGSDRDATFQLASGVALYGGFEGTETLLGQRDWVANATILSGDIGIPDDSSDNSYIVVTGSSTDATAVLDGFTVTAGAGYAGAGMMNDNGSPTVVNVTFSRNVADYGAGMINWSGSNPTLLNVVFSENSASYDGGGLYTADGGGVTLTNVVFWGNTAGQHGGGMFDANFLIEVTLTNVTFSSNVAAVRGGGMYNDTFSPTLTNVVLWGDSATSGGDEIYNAGTAPLISYSLIEGSGGSGGGWDSSLGTDGGNNLDADPLFADAAGGNVRLNYGSPAADVGDNGAPNLPATDLDGNLRIVGGTVDMGAYEFGSAIYVDESATGADSGSSWTDAFTDLQDALTVAVPGDEIWVAAGTYKPTSGTDRLVTFQLASGVALYGGFEGTEALLGQRDWVANATILSGDIGIPDDSSDNSYSVVTGTNTDATAVLDGFTVTAGAGYAGAGMVNNPGSPTVVNVTFSRNVADYGAGMINWSGSNPTLLNVVFSENSASYDGGGLYTADGGGVTLTNVVFWGNTAGQHGGGMFDANFLIEVTLTNVTFSSNVAAVRGGGMYNDTFSPTLTNVVLWGNYATSGGNEIYNAGTAPLISYSLIEGSGGSGGGWDSSLGTDGGNNLDADPLFADAAGGNVRLNYGSPAADVGDNGAPNLPATDLDGNLRIVGGTVDMGAYEFQGPTGVGRDDVLRSFRIVSISPNPFNPSTAVHFRLPEAMPVTAEIFSVTGARVRVLARGQRFGAGDNRLLWDGRNDQGSPVASGIYFVRLGTLLGSDVARAVLLK